MSKREEEEKRGNPNGPERRTDESSVRLALLEQSHSDNKESLISVHRRVTEFKSEVKEDMRIGFQDLKETIQESAKGCIACKDGLEEKIKTVDDKVGILMIWRGWITGAYVATTAIISVWINHRGK